MSNGDKLMTKIDFKKPLIGDVLIVEDDPEIVEILTDYCARMGCFRNVLVAGDGSTASNKLRNQTFALILLDLKLPKKGGLELVRELGSKAVAVKSKILIVSGSLDKTVVEKLIENGIKNFLPKPFNETGFQDRVLKILAAK